MWAQGLGCAEETPRGRQTVGMEGGSVVNLHQSVLLLLVLQLLLVLLVLVPLRFSGGL